MQCTQVERLKNDSRELDHYIYKLQKRGKQNLVVKLTKKRDFLNQPLPGPFTPVQIVKQ